MNTLPREQKDTLLNDGVLPPVSTGRVCVMHCLCDNWCHIGCNYQTYLGRVCPCHIKILDPRRKIMVLSRQYMEDYVVLPIRSGIRPEVRLAGRDLDMKASQDNKSLSRWCYATWVNLLVGKHAWLSVGLLATRSLCHKYKSYVQWRGAMQDRKYANDQSV